MAQKRAALLEKRMRREKESQQRKMQLEAELEQKKEEARCVHLRKKSYLFPTFSSYFLSPFFIIFHIFSSFCPFMKHKITR